MKIEIVVVKDLSLYEDQKERLEKLGNVTYYNTDPSSHDEWFERSKDAEIICSGMSGIVGSERVYEFENKYIPFPFVGVDFLDLKKLKEKNVLVSNAPGCNKEAVTEWVIGMILMFFRKLDKFNRATNFTKKEFLETGLSLFNKNVTILGKGNVGTYLGDVLKIFNCNVSYFTREVNLIDSVKDADIVINCLSLKKETENLLNETFFQSLKKGSLFVSASRNQIYDINALKKAIDDEILLGAIDDSASALGGDSNSKEYKELLEHPKILVTPHIAWCAESETRKANDIMLNNIEAYLNGKPTNLLN